MLGRKPEAIARARAARRAPRRGAPPEGAAAAAGRARRRRAAASQARRRRPRRRAGWRTRACRTAGAGIPGDSFNRPTDVAWDRAGNIYVADATAIGNARVAKFDKDGKFIKSWGSRGSEPGQFNIAARHRDRRAGQRVRRRRRQQAHPGVRRRRHVQDADPERRHADRALHHARAAPVPVQLELRTIRRRWTTARSTRWSWTARSSASSARPASC